jgi:hypothetical protein
MDAGVSFRQRRKGAKNAKEIIVFFAPFAKSLCLCVNRYIFGFGGGNSLASQRL